MKGKTEKGTVNHEIYFNESTLKGEKKKIQRPQIMPYAGSYFTEISKS